VRYIFAFDGSLSTPGALTPFVAGSARAQLNVQQQNLQPEPIVEVDSARGSLGHFSAIDGSTTGFAAGIGSISVNGNYTSANPGLFQVLDLPMNWNQPWEVQVGLLASVIGGGDAQFGSTAKLVSLEFFDAAGQQVTDFSLTSASGTAYGVSAPTTPVPEPATLTLTALGLTGLVTRYRRRRSRSAS
jgi:hypothetical protein